ncbi:DUF3291 domain-containing protein [Streptomyces sp. SID11385]|uniref:DUF3291 domain-containing protein n=1 Tax=Streptomyces sp. SID11385 TaxID=2706031 RepID=UPI0013C6B5FE|nr:DUF3291 domain-containing protein [Streptomyces sp. SID11385]NEA39304.1 DUF3291 domain-containing protein [Streptomyces sp. SID11385]
MPRAALYTFGVLRSPLADPGPLTRAFQDSGEPVYDAVARHPGYLARAESTGGSGTPFDADWGAWGEFAVPAWYDKGRTADTVALAATLSLWTDPRAAFDAVYSGAHREALNRRADWFERTGRPGHVCWWVAEDAIPGWRDGVAALEHLDAHGPAPHAFTFPHAFTPEGAPAGREGAGHTKSPGA